MPPKKVPGFMLQENPVIYCALMPGRWLLKRCTPAWRIKDPIKGFQRYVNPQRAQKIAMNVLDQQRTYPNAVVLATNIKGMTYERNALFVPTETRFFIVDGQHRVWALNYANYDTRIACVIHLGLKEADMADLFLEINDNQKRVPSSLRWDLLRLVRPDTDPSGLLAAELVYRLATEKDSPLFQHIDLTGELKHVSLKQGSVAPELKTLVTRCRPLRNLDSDTQYEVLAKYISAIKSLDSRSWKQGASVFYKARILRAMLRLLGDIIAKEAKLPNAIPSTVYLKYIKRIRVGSLESRRLIAMQGNAGILALYAVIKRQALG